MRQLATPLSFGKDAKRADDLKAHLPSQTASFSVVGKDQIGITIRRQTDRRGLASA